MRIDTSKLVYPPMPGSELDDLHQRIEALAVQVKAAEQVGGELREQRAAAEGQFRRKQYATSQMTLAERDEIIADIQTIAAKQAENTKALEPLNAQLQGWLEMWWRDYHAYARVRASENARRVGGG